MGSRRGELEGQLRELYYDLAAHPRSALASVNKLLLEAQALKGAPVARVVREYLHGQRAYTRHRPAVRRAVRRNRMLSAGIGTAFQADLSDMGSTAPRRNGGTRFLLCVIDIFSRRAWVRPLRDKTGASVRDAFEAIWTDPAMPPRTPTVVGMRVTLATDAGKEFLNAPLRRWLAERDIHHYVLHGEHKAAVVERFQRTLKERLHRLMTARGRAVYIDRLQEAVAAYNATEHGSLGIAPLQVTRENEWRLHRAQYMVGRRRLARRPRDDLNPGDMVKVSIGEDPFRKGFRGYWRDERFRVWRVVQ